MFGQLKLSEEEREVRPQLEQLNLSNNRLFGTIPSSLGDFYGLKILMPSGNQFTGEIPSDIGRLKNILKSDMSRNNFSGEIPNEIAKVVFSYTEMSDVIIPEGWSNDKDPAKSQIVFFGEFSNTGPGSNLAPRAPFTKKLTDVEAKPFISLAYIEGSKWLLPPLAQLPAAGADATAAGFGAAGAAAGAQPAGAGAAVGSASAAGAGAAGGAASAAGVSDASAAGVGAQPAGAGVQLVGQYF